MSTRSTTRKRKKKAQSLIVDDVRADSAVKLVVDEPPELVAAPEPDLVAVPEPDLVAAPAPPAQSRQPRMAWATITDVEAWGPLAFFVQIIQLIPLLISGWKERRESGMPFYRNLRECLTQECFDHVKRCLGWFWTMRTPMVVLGAIAIAPKMLLLWMFIILAKPISVWSFKRLPPAWKTTLALSVPKRVRQSEFVRELNEGADQGLPFMLFWLYLCCIPFSLTWMAVHWFKGLLPECEPSLPADQEGFVYVQNRKANNFNSETNFYSSRAFAPVVFLFFALGIPAFFSYGIYERLGVEQTLKSGVFLSEQPYPTMPSVERPNLWVGEKPSGRLRSSSPSPSSTQEPAATVLPATRALPLGAPDPHLNTVPQQGVQNIVTIDPTDNNYGTVVTGYSGYWPWLRNFGVEPTKASVFFVHFYLVSLAGALCLLFFRAWFQFPLEFLTDEHEVEFTSRGVRRRSFKGWFRSVLTMNGFGNGAGPDELRWHEILSLRKLDEGFTRLYPLPEAAFRKESLTYKLLNKVAALVDGVSVRMNSDSRFLVFSAAATGSDHRRNIKVNLNDLNREQRARLFYAVKKWAPHVIIQEAAEEQLIGSTVLRDNRYTQLWFDMLTSKNRARRKTALNPGDSLKDGNYKVEDRISSGGQATTYTATNAAGERVVLKEFILSTSAESAALVESAREFEAEVSLLSQLDHPGIVKLQDFFFEQGRVYVVLEHINGQSLRQLVQNKGPLSEAEVVRIGKSICTVLEYLHGGVPPIVHRDITPENILITDDGDVKLIDFSLAVRQDGRQTTDSCAKQCFTPPEQFREEVTVQSDLYALGATMYFLLTGSTPKPISCSSPKQKAEHVSDQVNAIIERATKLDLKDRYETAAWLKLDLEQLD